MNIKVNGITKTRKNEIANKGLQNTKPFKTHFFDDDTQVSTYNRLAKQYKNFIEDCGPYIYFITLTFGGNCTHVLAQCKNTNFLLHLLNQRIYKKRYKKNKLFMEGFAFFEKHMSVKSADRFHIHLLIKYNDRYLEEGFSIEELIDEAIDIVRDTNKNRIFSKPCIDVRDPGPNDRVGYCMKRVCDRNITNIKILDKDGLSDSSFD